jgi:hypothetical protein
MCDVDAAPIEGSRAATRDDAPFRAAAMQANPFHYKDTSDY